MNFFKYQGLGNDFIVVETSSLNLEAAKVRQLCDRHLGIGADGLIALCHQDATNLSMRVYNADGSVAEMCGNGLRCVALHATRQNGDSEFLIRTDAGPHRCRIEERSKGAWVVCKMPAPSFEPSSISRGLSEPLLEGKLIQGRLQLCASALSMGNPHLVLFDCLADDRAELGEALQSHAAFPEGVNVGFATLTENGIELQVWERGVGWTQACGTGACAAAVVAVRTGRCEEGAVIRVSLPGGELEVRVGGPQDSVEMGGPAAKVFEGRIDSDAWKT